LDDRQEHDQEALNNLEYEGNDTSEDVTDVSNEGEDFRMNTADDLEDNTEALDNCLERQSQL
jgi:hypothetical protein